jgi:hypothetical protein
MKNQILKLILLILISAVSIEWCTNNLHHLLNSKKYDYSSLIENEKSENKTENKLTFEFLNEINTIPISFFEFSKSKNSFIHNTNKVDDVLLKRNIPPPKSFEHIL